MFKTIDEVKEFLIWAKDQKIRKVNLGKVEVEFSDIAFVEQFYGQDDLLSSKPATLADTEPVDPQEEEDILFHSSGM